VLGRFDIQLFAASVDTPAENARFAESLGISYPILSDPSRDVARAFGVLSRSGYASRWTFYIGVDGRVLAIDKEVHAASHGREMAARLEELGVTHLTS